MRELPGQLDLFHRYRCGPYDCESSAQGFCLWCHFPCQPREYLQRQKRLWEVSRGAVVRLWRRGVQALGALCDASGLSVPAVWAALRDSGVRIQDLPRWTDEELAGLSVVLRESA